MMMMMYHYVHGGDIYEDQTGKVRSEILDFSANINPYGMPQGVIEAMSQSISNCVRYPDPFCRELSDKVAEFEGVRREQIFFSNGAAEVLFRLVLASKPVRALLCAPTFADYEKALKTVGCQIEYHLLSETREFRLEEDYLSKITPEIDLLLLCNPANPTGQVTEKPFLKKILDKAAECHAMVVVDECFMDFVLESDQLTAKGWLDEFPNLVIIRAFTKNFALPGIRLGYALCSNLDFLVLMRENGQDWSVSTLAQAAGIAATKEQEYLRRSCKMIEEERGFLKEQLEFLGIKTYPASANFILFRVINKSDLKEALMKHGILIRSCGNYRNLGSDYYRIAVRYHDQNETLLSAMRFEMKGSPKNYGEKEE